MSEHPDPITRRLYGVLDDLRMTRHGPQVEAVRREYAAGRMTLGDAFDAVRPLCFIEEDAARIVRAMVSG
ncbi:hypothetical protein [Deinococcus sp. NW-56]|uniref:hypothetical protein n=1 Tax=Deinococcus sp. NW-56 TaxID=2080419 RepID=UPI00131A13A8|nr:hypothetical protein [Deinococcus sp. NW-56]